MRHNENTTKHKHQSDISFPRILSMTDAEQSQDESASPRSRHSFAQSRVTPQSTTATAGCTRRTSQRPYPHPSSLTPHHQDLKPSGSVPKGLSPSDSSAIGNHDKLCSDFNLRPFLDSPRSQIGNTTSFHTDASSPLHNYLPPDVTDTDHSGGADDDARVSRPPSPQEKPSETDDNADLQRWTDPDSISHMNKYDKTKIRHDTSEVSAQNSARDRESICDDNFHYPAPRAELNDSDDDEWDPVAIVHGSSTSVVKPPDNIAADVSHPCSGLESEGFHGSDRTSYVQVYRRTRKEMQALHPRLAHIKRLRLRSGATNGDENGDTSSASTPPPGLPEESSSSSMNVDQPELPRPCAHPLTFDSVEENTNPPESPRLHPFTTDFEDEFEEEVEDDEFDYFDPETMRTVPSSLLTTPPPPPGPTELTPTSIQKLAIMRHNRRFTSRGVRYPGYPPSMLGPDWGKFHGKRNA